MSGGQSGLDKTKSLANSLSFAGSLFWVLQAHELNCESSASIVISWALARRNVFIHMKDDFRPLSSDSTPILGFRVHLSGSLFQSSASEWVEPETSASTVGSWALALQIFVFFFFTWMSDFHTLSSDSTPILGVRVHSTGVARTEPLVNSLNFTAHLFYVLLLMSKSWIGLPSKSVIEHWSLSSDSNSSILGFRVLWASLFSCRIILSPWIWLLISLALVALWFQIFNFTFDVNFYAPLHSSRAWAFALCVWSSMKYNGLMYPL